MFSSFAQRDLQPELMDQPGLSAETHRAALAGLNRINAVSGTAALLWKQIRPLAHAATPETPLRVLDIACGGGDVARALARRAERARLPMTVDGCDHSETALALARSTAEREGLKTIRFFEADVIGAPLPDGYDVLTCSLFLHHLDCEQAVQLLGNMRTSARRMVLLNDLRRSRGGWMLAWLACQTLSRSPIVHHDGPQSISAAFTIPEAVDLARRAGMSDARFSRHWPLRFLLTWKP